MSPEVFQGLVEEGSLQKVGSRFKRTSHRSPSQPVALPSMDHINQQEAKESRCRGWIALICPKSIINSRNNLQGSLQPLQADTARLNRIQKPPLH